MDGSDRVDGVCVTATVRPGSVAWNASQQPRRQVIPERGPPVPKHAQ
jgi:hypothetical protein